MSFNIYHDENNGNDEKYDRMKKENEKDEKRKTEKNENEKSEKKVKIG